MGSKTKEETSWTETRVKGFLRPPVGSFPFRDQPLTHLHPVGVRAPEGPTAKGGWSYEVKASSDPSVRVPCTPCHPHPLLLLRGTSETGWVLRPTSQEGPRFPPWRGARTQVGEPIESFLPFSLDVCRPVCPLPQTPRNYALRGLPSPVSFSSPPSLFFVSSLCYVPLSSSTFTGPEVGTDNRPPTPYHSVTNAV